MSSYNCLINASLYLSGPNGPIYLFVAAFNIFFEPEHATEYFEKLVKEFRVTSSEDELFHYICGNITNEQIAFLAQLLIAKDKLSYYEFLIMNSYQGKTSITDYVRYNILKLYLLDKELMMTIEVKPID